MSHIPQRKEKDCLNCGTIVQGRYCQHCGQENVVPKETFWHMVTHFFYDITHFDSNFFSSIHHLILRPGFLSKEYMQGKRVRYLHPIRMYVFTSAFFFLIFFSFFSSIVKSSARISDQVTGGERRAFILRMAEKLKKDSANVKLRGILTRAQDSSQVLKRDDINEFIQSDVDISFGVRKYNSVAEYDSVQRLLPREKRDNWFKRKVVRAQITLNDAYSKDPRGTISKLIDNFLHRLPYLLFCSLPLFALILKLVYIRRKQFYYADHGVFTIHLYIFSFLLLLLVFTVMQVQKSTNGDWPGWVNTGLFLLLFFYLYKAMRKFYGQRRFKTFIKFLITALLSLIMMVLLFAFFVFFSAITF